MFSEDSDSGLDFTYLLVSFSESIFQESGGVRLSCREGEVTGRVVEETTEGVGRRVGGKTRGVPTLLVSPTNETVHVTC